MPAEWGYRTNVAVVFLTACSDIDTFDAKESGSGKPAEACCSVSCRRNLALSGLLRFSRRDSHSP